MSRQEAQKKKAREERLRKQKHAEAIRRAYPAVVMINEDVVTPEFRIALQNAIDKINFEDIKELNAEEDARSYLKAIASASSFAVHQSASAKRLVETIHLYVATIILKNLGMNFIQNYMPIQGFRIYICKNRIFVICKSFDTQNDGKGYYTNHRIIYHHEKPCKLFYSKHMFQRLQERLAYISKFNCNEYNKFFQIAKTFCHFYEYCDIGLYKITSSFDQVFLDFYGSLEKFELDAGLDSETNFDAWESHDKIRFNCYHLWVTEKLRPSINKDPSTKSILNFTVVKRLVCPFVKISPNNDHKNDGILIKTSLLPGFDGTIEYHKTMSTFAKNKDKELLFDIMRTPEKRYGKEFFQAQLIFHKAGIQQFYMYTNYDAVNFVTRSVGEDFDNIVEFKNKRRNT